jgi:hypothetical protein
MMHLPVEHQPRTHAPRPYARGGVRTNSPRDAEACLPTASCAAINRREFGVSRGQLATEIYTSFRDSKRGAKNRAKI